MPMNWQFAKLAGPRSELAAVLCRLRLAALALFAIAVLAACGAPEEPEEPETVVNLRVTAGTNINPDVDGRPSPAVMRLFVLSTEDAFRTATYFELRDEAEDILGDTLLAEADMLLNPGSSREQRIIVPNDARTMAVVVDYQDIENAVWRGHISIRTGEENNLRATLRGTEVVLGLSPVE